MKPLRHFCAAATLACLFTQAAWADDGVIHGGVMPPPPPPVAYSIDPDETRATKWALLDPVTEIAINLVQSMIYLF